MELPGQPPAGRKSGAWPGRAALGWAEGQRVFWSGLSPRTRAAITPLLPASRAAGPTLPPRHFRAVSAQSEIPQALWGTRARAVFSEGMTEPHPWEQTSPAPLTPPPPAAPCGGRPAPRRNEPAAPAGWSVGWPAGLWAAAWAAGAVHERQHRSGSLSAQKAPLLGEGHVVPMNRDLPPTPRPSVRNPPCSLHPPQKVETPPPAAIQGPPPWGSPPSFSCLTSPLFLSWALSCRHTLPR